MDVPIIIPRIGYKVLALFKHFYLWVVLFEQPFNRQLLGQPWFYKGKEILAQKPKQ
jgi:hypothetical protein